MRLAVAPGALIIAIVWALFGAQVGQAQDNGEDLTSLSLEELMDLEIIPIGILESHIHVEGQWMLGYQFMRMNMSAPDASDDAFMMNPTAMWMDMHMVMLMYGLTDDLTLMAMLPYRQSSMKMSHMDGMNMMSASQGLGDISLVGHYALLRRSTNYLIGGAGITIPTGSIDASQTTATSTRKLAYGMQLGAGVPELRLDLNLVHQSALLNAGAHIEGQWGFGRNDNGYRIGDRYRAGGWLTVKTSSWLAPSVHLALEHQLPISGADPAIAAGMSPANDPASYGATHVTLTPGVTFYAPDGVLEGQRLTVNIDFPLIERYATRFLERSWSFRTGWQWTF